MKYWNAGAAALALALALTGCGGGTPDADGGVREDGVFYEAAGIRPDAVLLTVDGREVAAERYLYWLADTCDVLADYAGGTPDWERVSGGQTLREYAKSQALADTVLYATVEKWAETYDCGLTPEDEAALDAQWAERIAAYGEEGYAALLDRMGVTEELARTLTADAYLYRSLYTRYTTEGSALYPSTGAPSADDFDRLLQSAADGAEVTLCDACEALDPALFYEKLGAARAKLPEPPPPQSGGAEIVAPDGSEAAADQGAAPGGDGETPS